MPADVVDDALCRQRLLMARLRGAEHWRRLVAARLDLAVAAVADIDDLPTELPGASPSRLRFLLGLPQDESLESLRLAESSRLLGLRAALEDLDAYTRTVRCDAEEATRRLVSLMAPGAPVVQRSRPALDAS